MKPADFTRWREAMKLTKREAAYILGVSVQTVTNWERGCRPDGRPCEIPRIAKLACRALWRRLDQPYP